MNFRKSEINYTITDTSVGVNSVNEVREDIKVLFFDLARRDVSVPGYGNDGENPVVALMYGDDEKITQLTIDLPGYEIISASITKYTLKVCLYKSDSLLDRLLDVQSEVKDMAMELLEAEHAIQPIDGYKYLEFRAIDSESVEYAGVRSSRCSCCSDEHYSHTIPSRAVFDADEREKYLQGLRDHVADMNRRNTIADQKRKDAERVADLKKIEELKAKHGVA